MTRRVRGALWPVPPAHRLLPASPPAVVAVNVEIDEQSKTVDFMIDSGADFTTLGPVAANELLGGERYGSLNFNDPQRSLAMHGVGQLAARAFLLDAQIMFRDDQGQRIPIPLVVAVAQPLPLLPSTAAGSDDAAWRNGKGRYRSKKSKNQTIGGCPTSWDATFSTTLTSMSATAQIRCL